jgi:hypothetical protein
MTSIYAAIVTALGIVLFLRKAWYNYTRLPLHLLLQVTDLHTKKRKFYPTRRSSFSI